VKSRNVEVRAFGADGLVASTKSCYVKSRNPLRIRVLLRNLGRLNEVLLREEQEPSIAPRVAEATALAASTKSCYVKSRNRAVPACAPLEVEASTKSCYVKSRNATSWRQHSRPSTHSLNEVLLREEQELQRLPVRPRHVRLASTKSCYVKSRNGFLPGGCGRG